MLENEADALARLVARAAAVAARQGSCHVREGVVLLAGDAYAITETLWSEQSRRLLDVGHAKGKVVRLETALAGIAIPLHDGAKRYYRDIGLLK